MILARERELELFEAGETVRSRTSQNATEPGGEVIDAPEPVPARQTGPTKIIFGLLVGFCSVANFVVL